MLVFYGFLWVFGFSYGFIVEFDIFSMVFGDLNMNLWILGL